MSLNFRFSGPQNPAPGALLSGCCAFSRLSSADRFFAGWRKIAVTLYGLRVYSLDYRSFFYQSFFPYFSRLRYDASLKLDYSNFEKKSTILYFYDFLRLWYFQDETTRACYEDVVNSEWSSLAPNWVFADNHFVYTVISPTASGPENHENQKNDSPSRKSSRG